MIVVHSGRGVMSPHDMGNDRALEKKLALYLVALVIVLGSAAAVLMFS
jgi:hypothetical protein